MDSVHRGITFEYWLQQSTHNPSVLMEQAEFMLKSLFIIHPNKHSHYKLRIVVNRDAQEQEVKKDGQKYQFKFSPGRGTHFEQPYGSIVLLERTQGDPADQRYLQIGKGDVDFNQILNQNASKRTAMNGVLYGTRANNYDKVIAKYVYEISKRRVDSKQITNKDVPRDHGGKLRFKDHIHKQKLPILKLKQSILDRSNEINAKILQLSESLTQKHNQSYVTQGREVEKPSVRRTVLSPAAIPQSISKELKENVQRGTKQRHYCYRINEKVERLLSEHDIRDVKWVSLKNIKIFARSTANLQGQNILLKIHDHYHSRLLDIIFKFQFNANNTPIDTLLPLPAATNYLSIDVTYQERTWVTLQGYTRVMHSITKTVELFNDSNDELGFISLEIYRNSDTTFDLQQYQTQKADFSTLIKDFPYVTSKALPKEPTRSTKLNPPLVSQSFQRKKANSGFDMVVSRRSNTQFIQKEQGQSKSRSKRVRRPKFSLQASDLPPRVLSGESMPATDTKTLSLKIKNIYIHLYNHETSGPLQLRFQANHQTKTVDVLNGFSDFEDSGPILLTTLDPKESIKVNCYEDGSHNLMGSCSINVQTLIKSSTGQFKIFLTRHDFLVGYISCDISLYRIKNNQIRAVKKQSPSMPIYSSPIDEYELSFSPEAVGYNKNISRTPASRAADNFNTSFLLEQSNFN